MVNGQRKIQNKNILLEILKKTRGMKFVGSFRLRNWKEHVFPQFKHVINGLTYPGSIMT